MKIRYPGFAQDLDALTDNADRQLVLAAAKGPREYSATLMGRASTDLANRMINTICLRLWRRDNDH